MCAPGARGWPFRVYSLCLQRRRRTFQHIVDALLVRMANRICSAAFRSPLKAPKSEQKQQTIESDEQRVALTSLTNVRSHSEQQHDSPQLHMESTLADPKATSLPGSPSPRKSGRRRSSTSSTEQHDSPARALLRAETALAEATAAALPESPSQPGRSGRRRSSVSSVGGRRSSTSSAGSGWGRAAGAVVVLLAAGQAGPRPRDLLLGNLLLVLQCSGGAVYQVRRLPHSKSSHLD